MLGIISTKFMCIIWFNFVNCTNSIFLKGQVMTSTDIFASSTMKTHYDVVIVGGGPSGLSALSSLARVRRTALLIDSGEYRSAQARNIHDLIGSDGMAPTLFREKARDQITRYPTAFLKNGTVTSISRFDNATKFIITISTGQNYTSRKVILATGIVDLLPNTPGIKDAWGGGAYWCVWCDSWEHRDQPLGIIDTLSKNIMNSWLQVMSLNKDIIIFLNGTDTPANRELLNKASPGWQILLNRFGVVLENRTITGIERLQDGSVVKNETSWEEYDIFRVKLEDGTKIRRAAFLISFPKHQRSYLASNIGVQLKDERILVDPSSMRAAPGVWAVGDANNDSITNVPHALYTGKKAAVHAHIELARENVAELIIKKRSKSETFEKMNNGLEILWDSLRR